MEEEIDGGKIQELEMRRDDERSKWGWEEGEDEREEVGGES